MQRNAINDEDFLMMFKIDFQSTVYNEKESEWK